MKKTFDKTRALTLLAFSISACTAQTMPGPLLEGTGASVSEEAADQNNGASDTASDVSEAAGDEPSIRFETDWHESQQGILEEGKTLQVYYNVARPQCRGEKYGRPAWGLTLYYRFGESGEIRSLGNAAVNAEDLGGTSYVRYAIPLETSGLLQIWFENSNVWGCHSWDSNLQENYRYEVKAAPKRPLWAGNASFVLSRATCNNGNACEADRHPLKQDAFRYDTWARQRAAIRQIFVEAWLPGTSDVTDAAPSALSSSLHYRYAGESEFRTVRGQFAQRAGNNTRFSWPMVSMDPFGDPYGNARLCPTIPFTHDSSYVRGTVEFFFDVGGYEVRPDGDSSFYTASFEQYSSVIDPDCLPTS